MSASLPDYYAILHVDPAAPPEVIRASYRTLMQQLRAHPDLGGDHEAATRLNVAYTTLKDPIRRAEYDARRAAEGTAGQPDRAAAQPTGASEPVRSTAAAQRGRNAASNKWQAVADSVARADTCLFCGTAAAGATQTHDSLDECRVCHAPLTLVQSFRRVSTEFQRSVYRIAKAEPLRVFVRPHDRAGIAALVHDISLTGMRFSCAHRFGAGDLIRVDCDICAAVARVAHVSPAEGGTAQYGAEFLTVRFKRQRGSLLSVPA